MPKTPTNPYPDWAGFDAPRYTPVPDDLFDLWLPHLTGAEVKVLLYICRRTFGFKKTADDISFSQLTDGITTGDGRVLDYGAGVGRTAAQEAVAGLVAKGLIVKRTNQGADGRNAATTYALRLRGETTPAPTLYVGKRHRGMPESDIALYREPTTQETAVQETESQEDSNRPAPQKAEDAPPYSAWIAGVILDFSGELGDAVHGPSNVTRALRLQQASGLDDATFVEACQAAKRALRQAQAHGVANKMAYFFTVLADQLQPADGSD